jgi:hypothetical protein
MSVLPRAVVEAARRADELQAEYVKGQNPEAETETPEGEAEPEQPEQTSEELTVSDTGGNQVDAAPEPTQNSDMVPRADYDKAVHSYRVLQGKYNAELPREQAKVTQLSRTVTEQAQQIAALTAQLEAKTPAQSSTSTADFDPKSVLTEEEINDHSPEFLALVAKMAKAAAAQATQGTVQKVESELGTVRQAQAATAEELYLRDLTNASPHWQQLNNDAGFLNFLEQVEPYSGQRLQDILMFHHQNHNVSGVAQIFNAYAQQYAAPATPRSVVSAEARSELEQQVAPSRTRGGATASPAKRTYTAADIQQFYADVSKGKYAGKQADKARIEADIINAQRDGRIR